MLAVSVITASRIIASNLAWLTHCCRMPCSSASRGIRGRIARRGVESSQRLGRHRWRVERTVAWLLGCRRLLVRFDVVDERFYAFVLLAGSLICFRALQPIMVSDSW